VSSYPRIFSIVQDRTWQEKLDEYFEETACPYDFFQTPEQYQTGKGESYQLGLIEPRVVSGEADFENCPLIKLGSGESEGLSFEERLDPSHSISELTAHLFKVLPRKTEPLSILLVDDDPDLCLLLKGEWENKAKTKTQVNVQPNGLEALKALEHFTPDVIVVDLKMPVLSGADFYKKYRKHNHPLYSPHQSLADSPHD